MTTLQTITFLISTLGMILFCRYLLLRGQRWNRMSINATKTRSPWSVWTSQETRSAFPITRMRILKNGRIHLIKFKFNMSINEQSITNSGDAIDIGAWTWSCCSSSERTFIEDALMNYIQWLICMKLWMASAIFRYKEKNAKVLDEIEQVNRKRKSEQEQKGEKLRKLENEYNELLAKNYEIEVWFEDLIPMHSLLVSILKERTESDLKRNKRCIKLFVCCCFVHKQSVESIKISVVHPLEQTEFPQENPLSLEYSAVDNEWVEEEKTHTSCSLCRHQCNWRYIY